MGIRSFFKKLFKDSPIRGFGYDDDVKTTPITTTVGKTYTVVKGDSLSAISLKYYGDANQYMKIYEANKPLLNDPDKIYPGQVLSIP